MKDLKIDPGFLLDIWAGLKAKKLAPVAVGLVLALVAMPVLMLKGESDPAAGPLPIATPADPSGSEVEVAQELADGDSKLDSYKARDPFKGLVKPDKKTGGSVGGAAVAPSDAAGTGEGADKGASLPSAPAGSGGPSGDGGSGGSGSNGSGSAPRSPSVPTPPPVKRERAFYNFQLDVKFGRPGREKRYPALGRLSFLPRPQLPIALFMGVNEGARKAIFFVHPGLNHQGEGVCIPRPDKCDFLELAVGRDHYFSASDLEFRMKLLAIKRVKASKDKRQADAARKTQPKRRAARSGDEQPESGMAAEDEEYEWPWLVDGIG